MTKAFFSGFVIIEEKEQPFDKSGLFKLVIQICFISRFHILCSQMYFCSNVVAATDVTLLAMAGIGLNEGKVAFLSELYIVGYIKPAQISTERELCA